MADRSLHLLPSSPSLILCVPLSFVDVSCRATRAISVFAAQTVGTLPNKWPVVETHGGLGTPGRKMTTSKAGGGSPASWEADAGSARVSSATSGIPASMEKVFKWGIDREGLAEYDGLEGSKSPVVTDAMSPTGTKGTAT